MIKIKTDTLQKVLNKAIKVCSFNKMLPLTTLIEISFSGKELRTKTTDNLTTLSLIEALEEEAGEMRAVVDALLFNNLINKITTEFVGIEIKDNALVIEGNGLYYLDIRIDETGQIIKFPEVTEIEGGKQFNFKDLVNKINIARASMPDNFDAKELNNYYLKDTVIATNAYKVSSIPNLEELKGDELFIPQDLGNILTNLDFGDSQYVLNGNTLIIRGGNFILQSVIGENLDKYPLDSIKDMLSTAFSYNVIIKRKDLLSILDRLSLFVREYHKNCIDITFRPDGLVAKSIEDTVKENIDYVSKEVGDLVEFNALINIHSLKEQLDALSEEDVTIYFGGVDNAIKIVEGNVIQISSLMTGE